MSNEFDNLAADVERVLEQHRPAIETALGVVASVVPNPAVDALLAELDDLVGRLHAANKPTDPTATVPAGADASPATSAGTGESAESSSDTGPSADELAAAQAVVDRAPAP